MDNSNKDNQSTPDLKVISILYPNLILLLVYYAEIRFSWFQLPELFMALFRGTEGVSYENDIKFPCHTRANIDF